MELELTSASLLEAKPEPTPESEPRTRGKKVLMAVAMLGMLAVGGFFIYATSTGTAEDKSEQLKNLQVMLGMGPKAGASRFVAPIVGALIIAAFSLSLLSMGGLDQEKDKEHSKKNKQAHGKKTDSKVETVAPPEELECNLSSYKLFYGPKEESTPVVPAAETPTQVPVKA